MLNYPAKRRPGQTESVYQDSDLYCDVAIPHPERLEVLHNDDLVLAY